MLIEAAVATSALFVVIVLGSLAYNPRLWIHDFPEAMREEMEPLSRRERLLRAPLAALLLLVVVGIPIASILGVKSSRGDITILEGFLHVWVVFMAVNLVDLVLVDLVIGIWWRPAFLSTPEIEPLLGHNTVRFHLVEHLEGTAALTVVALVLGVLVSL